ncbi:MAG: glycosyltransferase family 2 protein [Chloroflexi bacterium]|nr:glycosyltransferase family 2 protein [Chloroflexota bacterium]
MSHVPEVSIIIRTKNEVAKMEKCLTALLAQDTPRRCEIVVIDSGSTDGTLDICRRFPVRLHEIPPQEFNYGRTLNQGARLASGRFFVSFTAHALPLDDSWLERLLVHLDRDKRVAGVYSREVPWPEASPLEAARLHLRFPAQRRTFSPEERAEEDDGHPQPVIPFSNVASATQRELVLRFPFPELAYAEDRAWARMMLQRGYRFVYEPEARVYHSHDEGLPTYYRRQLLIGRSKRQISVHPPSLWSIARTALGDLSGQVRFFRQTLPTGQQAYWTAQGLLYCMTRIAAQTLGSRGQP